MTKVSHDPIGYLTREPKGYTVTCLTCAASGAESMGAVIYFDTIFPYNQNCGVCDKELVHGYRTWPQMFDGN